MAQPPRCLLDGARMTLQTLQSTIVLMIHPTHHKRVTAGGKLLAQLHPPKKSDIDDTYNPGAKKSSPGVTKGWCLVPSTEWIMDTPNLHGEHPFVTAGSAQQLSGRSSSAG